MGKAHDCFKKGKKHKNFIRNMEDGKAKSFSQRIFTVQILESYEEIEVVLIMGQDAGITGLNL